MLTRQKTLKRGALPEMEEYCEKIKQLIGNIAKNKDEIETRESEVKAAFDKCRKDVGIQLQKIIDRATEDYNTVMKELDIREEEEVDKLRLDRQNLSEYKQLVQWMETCKESAKEKTPKEELKTGLGKRVRQLAELKSIEDARDRISHPRLVLSTGKLSENNNVIGRIEYRNVKMLEWKRDCRNPEKPFKDILQGNFKQSKQVQLKHWCQRVSLIQGDIWAAVHGANCVQVIDVEGNPQRDISCTFTPYSVKEAPWGDIIVASDTGLHVMCPDGTVQSTICSNTFYDVCFFGEEIVGLNASKKILQKYQRTGDGEWRHSGDIGASRGIGSTIGDRVLSHGSEIIFTIRQESSSHYYKYDAKTGQRRDFSSSNISGPLICGVDSTGNVLVADNNNRRFQLHESENHWSMVSLDPISSDRPYDLLYDANTETVWVLSYKIGHYLTKLEKQL